MALTKALRRGKVEINWIRIIHDFDLRYSTPRTIDVHNVSRHLFSILFLTNDPINDDKW